MHMRVGRVADIASGLQQQHGLDAGRDGWRACLHTTTSHHITQDKKKHKKEKKAKADVEVEEAAPVKRKADDEVRWWCGVC